MRHWLGAAVGITILMHGACDADAPGIVANAESLGPEASKKPVSPATVAGAEVGVASDDVRRGQRLAGSGLSSLLFCERQFAGGLAFRGNASSFLQFRGADVSEAIYDAALALSKQRWLGNATVLTGYTYFGRNTNPASPAYVGNNTQEIYGGVEFAVPGQPYAYVRYDFAGRAGDVNNRVGTYLLAGASHRFPLSSDIAVELAGRLGLDFGRGLGGFNDALIQSRLRLRLAPKWTLVPAVDWWFPSGAAWPRGHGFRPVPSLNVAYVDRF